MADLLVPVPATRFVDTVAALRFARRQWHRLDGALVQVPHKQRTPAWQEAIDALFQMDHAIANATDGLLRVPSRAESRGLAASVDG